MAELDDKLRRIAMAIKETFPETVDEALDANARSAYFSDGIKGATSELLGEISEIAGIDTERDISAIEVLVLLRMIYPCFTTLFLSVKSRLATVLYSAFWQGEIQGSVDLKSCGALLEVAARGDDEIRQTVMAHLADIKAVAAGLSKSAEAVVGTISLLADGDRLQDGSILSQICRRSGRSNIDRSQMIQVVHSLLWTWFKNGVDAGELNPRMTVFIPSVARGVAIRDFLRNVINVSAGNLEPVTTDALLAINSAGKDVPVQIFGRVNQEQQPRFVRAMASRYDEQSDMLFYKASNHSCTHGFSNASKMAIFEYGGPDFKLLRKGSLAVRPVAKDSHELDCSALDHPIVIVGLNEVEAREVMSQIHKPNLTAMYISSAGGVKYLQNEAVAPKKALVFVSKVKVLTHIMEPRRDPLWQGISDSLGFSWDTSFDCILVDQDDKHTATIDENSRLVISVDSIDRLCDVTRINELKELIKNDEASEFAWTPQLCDELGVKFDCVNEIVKVPYSLSTNEKTEQLVNGLVFKARCQSGGMLAGRLRRVAFAMHAPVIEESEKRVNALRLFIDEQQINFTELGEIREQLSKIENGLAARPLAGSNCLATEKYRVVKAQGESVDPSTRIRLYHPVASEPNDVFVGRMSKLNCRRHVFEADRDASGADEVWYTAVRPGRREILDYLYPKAKKAVWFLYPLEEQLLKHLQKICNRFLLGLFPLDILCSKLGVKYESPSVSPVATEETESKDVSRKDRLDALSRYFDKMKIYGFHDEEAASESVGQADISWKITLDTEAVVWATDEYESLVEDDDGTRHFVMPKSLVEGSIVWELQPPREMVLLSKESIQRLVEKQGCPLYYGWKNLLNEYRVKCGISKRELHARIKAAGINVTYEAVLFWLADTDLMCPKNGARTLSIIADLIGSKELKEQAIGIELVAKTVRVFNQCEARDIYDTIRRAFCRGLSECEISDAKIDLNQYGLFSSGRVSTVESVVGVKKPGYLVNRILRGGSVA